MDTKRVFIVLRMLTHWSMGAAIGSILTANGLSKWTVVFVMSYVLFQLIAIPINPYRSKHGRTNNQN